LCKEIGRSDTNSRWVVDREDCLIFSNVPYKRLTLINLGWMCDNNWELVDSIPQYEEVEVVRWLNLETNSIGEYVNGEPCSKTNWVKLIGTIKREIKPKNKRREQIGFTGPIHINATVGIPDRAKYFAEWEE